MILVHETQINNNKQDIRFDLFTVARCMMSEFAKLTHPALTSREKMSFSALLLLVGMTLTEAKLRGVLKQVFEGSINLADVLLVNRGSNRGRYVCKREILFDLR